MSIHRRTFLRSLAALPIVGSGLLARPGQAVQIPEPGARDLLEVLNPTGDQVTLLQRPASRLATLEGTRVGLYISRRSNAFEVMGRIAANLRDAYPGIQILGGSEGTVWAKKAYDRPGDIEELLAQSPDAVILGIAS